MDEEKRELTVSEAGRLGGKKRAKELGPKGYAAMGQKGGATTKERHGTAHYVRIGALGGTKAFEKHGVERLREMGKKGGAETARRGRAAEGMEEELSRPPASRPPAVEEEGDV